jgi:hypothetical protein
MNLSEYVRRFSMPLIVEIAKSAAITIIIVFILRFGEDNAVRCCVGTRVERGGARDRL